MAAPDGLLALLKCVIARGPEEELFPLELAVLALASGSLKFDSVISLSRAARNERMADGKARPLELRNESRTSSVRFDRWGRPALVPLWYYTAGVYIIPRDYLFYPNLDYVLNIFSGKREYVSLGRTVRVDRLRTRSLFAVPDVVLLSLRIYALQDSRIASCIVATHAVQMLPYSLVEQYYSPHALIRGGWEHGDVLKYALVRHDWVAEAISYLEEPHVAESVFRKDTKLYAQAIKDLGETDELKLINVLNRELGTADLLLVAIKASKGPLLSEIVRQASKDSLENLAPDTRNLILYTQGGTAYLPIERPTAREAALIELGRALSQDTLKDVLYSITADTAAEGQVRNHKVFEALCSSAGGITLDLGTSRGALRFLLDTRAACTVRCEGLGAAGLIQLYLDYVRETRREELIVSCGAHPRLNFKKVLTGFVIANCASDLYRLSGITGLSLDMVLEMLE